MGDDEMRGTSVTAGWLDVDLLGVDTDPLGRRAVGIGWRDGRC